MSKTIPNTKTLTVTGESYPEGKKVVISKVAIGRLVEALKLMQGEGMEALAGENQQDQAMAVAMNIEKYAPAVSKILNGQLTKEELMDAHFESIIDLVLVFLEVNNVAEIIGKVKKGLTLFQPGAAAKKQAIG